MTLVKLGKRWVTLCNSVYQSNYSCRKYFLFKKRINRAENTNICTNMSCSGYVFGGNKKIVAPVHFPHETTTASAAWLGTPVDVKK
jgi:hypothetical protein